MFYLGGNWQAAVIESGLKANAGFMDMPPGASGKYVAIGATSLPWHISAKSKYPDVGAAFINWLIAAPGSAQKMYAQNQIPAVSTAPAAKGNAYLSSIATGWQQLVKSGGLTLFPDWASTNMLDRDEHGVPEDDRPAPDAGGDRQDDPERMDDVR